MAWQEWDLPRLIEQTRYWRKHPPTHMLVAAYLEYKPSGTGTRTNVAANDASIQALMASAPQLPEHLKLRLPNHG